MTTETYTYTIFDADPNQSSGTAWDTHTNVEIEAEDDVDAIDQVNDVLEAEAAGLNASDYDVGDVLYGMVWAPDGIALRTVTYTLTAEDLGVEEEEEEDEDEASDEIDTDDLCAFGQLPSDAGQMVEVHYAVDWGNGLLVRRAHDRSDRTTTYQVRDLDNDATEGESEFEPWNGRLPKCKGEWREATVK
jgi:hypothetical protein